MMAKIIKENFIIGVDPGLAHVGWGIIKTNGGKLSLVEENTIITSSRHTMASRLIAIYEQLMKPLDFYNPREAAVESLFFQKNASSGMEVMKVVGIIEFLFAQRGIDVTWHNPMSVKKTVVGSGNASKNDIKGSVVRTLSLFEGYKFSSEHAADALAIAICRYQLSRKMGDINGIDI